LLFNIIRIKACRTVILPVVLYRYETWCLPLREEYRLRIFDKGCRRKMFGLKREEVTGDWRRLHNEGIRDMCSSPNVNLG
jgi:hypothetical protein